MPRPTPSCRPEVPAAPADGREGLLFAAAGPSAPPTAAAAPAPAPGSDPGPGPVREHEIPAIADPAQVRAAVDWLRWGRSRSLPSEALLFAAMAGTPPAATALHGNTLPDCRSELYGCLRLTHDLPWTRRGLDVLAEAWPGWRAFRAAWDRLSETMVAEVGPTWPEIDRGVTGFWPDTPATVELLRRTLAQGGVKS